MTQIAETQHQRRVKAAAAAALPVYSVRQGESAEMAAERIAEDVLRAADAVTPAALPEGREVFSVPPGTPLSEVLDHSLAQVTWAVQSGSYAPPEMWFPRIPAYVALLRETSERLRSIVEAYEQRETTADDEFAETLARVLA